MTTREATTDQRLLSFLDGVIGGAWPSCADTEPDEDLWLAMENRAANARPIAERAAGLFGSAPDSPPAVWHLNGLREGDRRQPGEADKVRAAYHARWLGRFLFPDEARFQPKVSVVIPVHNRASTIAAAVDSALGQTYPAVEVIGVDDGSSDETGEILAAYGERIRVYRQENRGVSAARNAAIEMATGDYIHFLDSDDILHSECLSRKVAAFAVIADADLCFHRAIEIGPRGLRFSAMKTGFPDGGKYCPTTDFMVSITNRMPFVPSMTMLTRWRALDAPRFDEDVHFGEDHRYYFHLARLGIKVCGLRDQLTLKRERTDSLSLGNEATLPTLRLGRVRTLTELVEAPELWQHLPSYLGPVAIPANLWNLQLSAEEPAVAEICRRLLDDVESYGDGARRSGLSPLIILHLLLITAGRFRIRLERLKIHRGSFHIALVEALDQAIRTAAPLTRDDVEFWRAVSVPPLPQNGVLALIEANPDLAALEDAPSRLTDLIRRWSSDPGPRRWALLLQLTPRVGIARAQTIAQRVADVFAPGTAAGSILVVGYNLRRGVRRVLKGSSRLLRVAIRRTRTAHSQDRVLRNAGFPTH